MVHFAEPIPTRFTVMQFYRIFIYIFNVFILTIKNANNLNLYVT